MRGVDNINKDVCSSLSNIRFLKIPNTKLNKNVKIFIFKLSNSSLGLQTRSWLCFTVVTTRTTTEQEPLKKCNRREFQKWPRSGDEVRALPMYDNYFANWNRQTGRRTRPHLIKIKKTRKTSWG